MTTLEQWYLFRGLQPTTDELIVEFVEWYAGNKAKRHDTDLHLCHTCGNMYDRNLTRVCPHRHGE